MLPVRAVFLRSDVQPGTRCVYSSKQNEWLQNSPAYSIWSNFIVMFSGKHDYCLSHTHCFLFERSSTIELASPNRFHFINHTVLHNADLFTAFARACTLFPQSCKSAHVKWYNHRTTDSGRELDLFQKMSWVLLILNSWSSHVSLLAHTAWFMVLFSSDNNSSPLHERFHINDESLCGSIFQTLCLH